MRWDKDVTTLRFRFTSWNRSDRSGLYIAHNHSGSKGTQVLLKARKEGSDTVLLVKSLPPPAPVLDRAGRSCRSHDERKVWGQSTQISGAPIGDWDLLL